MVLLFTSVLMLVMGAKFLTDGDITHAAFFGFICIYQILVDILIQLLIRR